MIPGMSNIMPKGGEKEASKKIKRYICIMDSMTDDELSCKVKIDENRIKRIVRGSGSSFSEVKMMLEEYRNMAKIMEKMGGLTKGKGGDITQIRRNPEEFYQKFGGVIPQDLLSQFGGSNGIMNMMKEFGNMGGLPNITGFKRKIKKK